MKNFTHAFFTTKSTTIKWVFAVLTLFFLSTQESFAQTPYVMSGGNYTEAFTNIANTTNWPVGLTSSDSAEWGPVAVNATGSIPDGKKTTVSSATFTTTTAGGMQRGTAALLFLSTGSAAAGTAVAVDVFFDFTGRTAGTLSFDWAAIDNGAGTRPTSLRVYWSTDGTTFTEITGAQSLERESGGTPASGSITSVALPSAFNGSSTARLRFYNYAGTATGSGNRDKMQIDNISVTSTAAVTTYTVTYNGNSQTSGTAPTDGSSPYSSSATVTVLGNTGTLTRTNYTFSDWNTAADGSGTNRAAASTFTIGANTTLYAKWTGSVTYNGNSNTGGSAPSTATVIAGATYTVAANSGTLTRTNYTFAGWNTQADGLGTNYTAGSGTFAFAGNTTLYAKWTGNVTYNGNGNTGGSVPTDATNYVPSQSVTTAANSGTLVKSGSTFAGWNTQADGLGTDYAVSTAGAFTFAGNVTLYAKWNLNSTFAVTYNGNGNTGGTPPSDATAYASGNSVNTLGNTGTLVKTGYTFAGWNTLANGTGTDYTAPQTGAFTITTDVTLYAKWTGTVTYDANSATTGTAPTDATVYLAGNTVTVAANSGTLARTGYTFAGWNTLANGTGTSYTAGSGTFAFAGNVTLYARWTGTVTYDGNGNTSGSAPTDATAYRPTQTVTVANNTGSLVKTGSTFAGWNTQADGLGTNYTAGSGTFAFAGNVTLYAKWNALSTIATLATLSVSAGTISPAFNSATTAYTLTIPWATTGTTVTATPTDVNVTSMERRTNANAYANLVSGVASSTLGLPNITPTDNTLNVRVTAEDGTTQIIYTITITRSANTDANLFDLSTSAGLPSPAFASATTSYTRAVPYSTAFTVTPTINSGSGATLQIRLNGGSYSAISSGSASSTLALNVGSNTIDVLVTAQDGVTTKTYTITATKAAPSTVSTLSALTTTAGTLAPSFATATTTYTASVAGTTSSVTVTPTKTDTNATIQVRVNGGSYAAVTSGSASGALSLNVGTNPIDVLVTAQDGTTTTTYTITVTRAAPPIWENVLTGTSLSAANPYTTNQTFNSNLSSVSGIGVTGAAATGNTNDRYNTNTWPVSPAGIDTGKYIYFTLTPAATYKIDFTNFKFTNQYSAALASAVLAVRSSADSYATNIATPTIGASGSATSVTVDLSGGAFQNVQVPITFRVYLYNVATTGSTFSINDFEFNGSVSVATPAPEMNVVQGTSIASGGTYAFGNQENGTSSSATTFTIENLGNAVLNLTGTPKVAISGTNAADFTINETATTATVASTTGTTTFTVTFTPGSAGAKTAQLSIANDDATGSENPYLINLTGTGTTSQQSTIAAATFTAPTNVAYGSYQANDITSGNSLEVGQFTIQDGASDNDSFGTILSTITLSLTNSANVKRVALYDGATELQEIAAGATNTFNAPALASNLFTTDGGSKTFSVRVTFNSTVTDNQQYQFTVTGATADAAGSGFTTVGGSTSIAGNNNKIVVTANRLTFGTVTGSSINVTLPSFTISTTDGLGNVDLDKSAAVTLGSTSAFPSANFTRTTPTYALTGGSITISNVAFADAQSGITLTADATGLSQGVSNTFDILLVTFPANSYRSTGAGNWTTATWERFVSNVWGSSAAPSTSTTNTVYIRHAISSNGSITPSTVVIENGGTLTYTASSSCATSMTVESGGTLQINAAMVFTGATVTVESGGVFNVNYATASGVATLWGGTEDFQDGSTVNIQNWNYGAGSGDNRLIQNPSIISPNTAGYYFGNLTISGAPSAIFVVVEGGQSNVKICQNNFTATNTAQVVALGNTAGSAIIGGNVVGNSTGTSFAFSASSGLYTTTINGNLSGSGPINLSTQAGAQTSIVQLKGNLSITGSLSVTSDTGTIVFSGTSGTQTLSIAGTLNTRVAFEVGDGTNASEVQLINQNLSLTNALNKLTVNDKGILDFNNRDVTGAGIFALNTGGELKITSSLGINASGTNTGNLQNTASRTISQSGIFHYIGNATPQSTGTAITSGSTAKRIIIEKTNPTDVVNLTQSTGTTDRLEIIEGTFVETAAANITGSGNLVMSGGTYKTAVLTTVPQLSGTYTLTGGTIDLNGAGDQILRGSKAYSNLTFSTSGTKTLSSAPDSVTGTATIQNAAILNVASNTFGGAGTNLTMLGTSRYITDGSGVKPDAEGTYNLAATSTIEFANTSAGIIRLGLSPISYGKIEVTGTNVSSTSTTTGILFQSGGSFTVKGGASFTFRQPGGLNGLVNSAVSSTNSPTVTIENTPSLSTIVYNGAGQSLTGRADYGNLIINNTSGALTTSGDVTASGTLTLTKGIVTTGANTIAVTNDTTPISGGSSTAYINGKLSIGYPATGTDVARTFPIGKGGAYRPVTFTYDSPASRTVLIEQFEAAFPGGVPSSATQFGTRYWNITQSSTGGSYKVTLDAGGATSSSSIVIIRREGASASTSNASDVPNYTNVASFATTNVSNDVSLGVCATCTALSPAFRGATLSDLNSQMSAVAVSGATTYRFEIKNTTSNVTTVFNLSSPSFNLTQLSAGAPAQTVAYNTVYAIRVAVNNGGFIYGTSYNVTTIPSVRVTKITNKQCGTTLPKLDEPIYCDQVFNGNKFRFLVNGGSIVNQEFDSSLPYFNLTQLTGTIAYSTAYTIRVKASTDKGVTWPTAYGTTCSVTTPATPPLALIMSPKCGITLAALNAVIYATPVYGANQYRFEVSGGVFVSRDFITANTAIRLTSLLGGAEYGTTYSIRVASSIDNGASWLPFGPTCSFTTPAAPITRMAAQDINSNVFEVKAFPNPFARHFSLAIQSSSDDLVEVKVYDMIGRALEVQKATVSELSTKEIGSNYPSGVYNVVVSQGDKVKSIRMIKR